MKLKGLKGNILTEQSFRDKLRINEDKYSDLAYFTYLLSKVNTTRLGFKDNTFTIALIANSPRLIREDIQLDFTLRKLITTFPKFNIEPTARGFSLFYKDIKVCDIIFATKDNCASACLGATLVKYVYFDDKLTYTQKKFKERLRDRVYSFFGKKYSWIHVD